MKNDYFRLYVGQCLCRLDQRFFQFVQRLAPLSGHAQPGDVNASARRRVLIELWLGQPIAGRNDQTDARLGIHCCVTFPFQKTLQVQFVIKLDPSIPQTWFRLSKPPVSCFEFVCSQFLACLRPFDMAALRENTLDSILLSRQDRKTFELVKPLNFEPQRQRESAA